MSDYFTLVNGMQNIKIAGNNSNSSLLGTRNILGGIRTTAHGIYGEEIQKESEYCLDVIPNLLGQEEFQRKNSALKCLLENTGCRIQKVNGQRFYGISKNLTSCLKTPSRGYEIFCDGLPELCYEDELVPFFEKVGTIQILRTMINLSGVTRPFCFVRYTTEEAARYAVKYLHREEIRKGVKVKVKLSVDNKVLIISNLKSNKTAVEIFKEANCAGLLEVIKLATSDVVLRFATHQDASQARRIMIPTDMDFRKKISCESVDWEPEDFKLDRRDIVDYFGTLKRGPVKQQNLARPAVMTRYQDFSGLLQDQPPALYYPNIENQSLGRMHTGQPRYPSSVRTSTNPGRGFLQLPSGSWSDGQLRPPAHPLILSQFPISRF